MFRLGLVYAFLTLPVLLVGAGNCPDGSPGTTVVFVNGINTTEFDAWIDSQALLAKLYPLLTAHQRECTLVTYQWNTHGTWIGDLLESARQLVGDDTSLFYSWLSDLDDAPVAFKVLFETLSTQVDEAQYVNVTDLANQVSYYEDQINNDHNTVIVVPHSQGNWFANESYRSLRNRGMTLPEPAKFNIVSVATPASTVEGYASGHDKYTTLCEDFIWKVPNALTYNLTNDTLACAFSILNLNLLFDPGFWKHDFVTSYLADRTNSKPVILGEIAGLVRTGGPQVTILSTFGPNSSFETIGGLVIGSFPEAPPPPPQQMVAMSFTPSQTLRLSSIHVAVSYHGGPNQLTVYLSTGATQPSFPIESFNFTNISSTASILTATSVSNPQLSPGVTYWVVVTTADLVNSYFVWHSGSPPVPGTFAYQDATSGGWHVIPVPPPLGGVPAFSVVGTP